jgi:hypothetical protein
MGRVAQPCLGLMSLIFGCAMLLTLWLIPFGLCFALLGLALMSAPAS